MKEPWQWTEGDLLAMIAAGFKESITVEFKQSYDLDGDRVDKKEKIATDVSAFANSAGGTIIYGMKEDGHVAKEFDPGVDPSKITKEWLEEVINSNIQRRIDGIRINQIELHQTHPGRVAYVVHIPQSNRAPHQAPDRKFYKRYNFQSIAMEEYEIRDTARRSETPKPRIEFQLRNGLVSFGADRDLSEPIEIGFSIHNDAIEPVAHAVIRVLIDARLDASGGGFNKAEARMGDLPVSMFTELWAPPNKMPVMHTLPFTVGTITLHLRRTDIQQADYLLSYEVATPRVDIQRGFAILQRRESVLTILVDPEPARVLDILMQKERG